MKFFDAIEGFASQLIFEAKENAPTLCIIGASICAVGAVIAAVKASKKADADIQEAKEDIKEIRENSKVDPAGDVEVPQDETNAKIVKRYLMLALRLTKRYAVTALFLVACIFLMAKANDIHLEREAGLVASIGFLQDRVDEYRKDVANVIGEDKEKDIWNGVETVEKVVGKDNEGKDIVEKEQHVVNTNRIIVCNKDNMMPGFYKSNHIQMGYFLRGKENAINAHIAVNGYIFENRALAEIVNLKPMILDPEGQRRGKLRDGVAFSLNLHEVIETDPITGDQRKEWAIQPNFDYGIMNKVFLHRSGK